MSALENLIMYRYLPMRFKKQFFSGLLKVQVMQVI